MAGVIVATAGAVVSTVMAAVSLSNQDEQLEKEAEKTSEAENNMKAAEKKTKEAERKTKEAEEKTKEAERKKKEAEEKTKEAEKKTKETKEQLARAEAQLQEEAEQRKLNMQLLKKMVEAMNHRADEKQTEQERSMRREAEREKKEAEREKKELERKTKEAESEKKKAEDQCIRAELEKQRMRNEMEHLRESKRLRSEAKMLQQKEIEKQAQSIQDLKRRFKKILNIEEKFEMVRALGTGGFGEVNAWKSRETDEVFAVKEVAIKDKDNAKALFEEGEKLSKLKHENVVKMFEVFLNPQKTKVLLFLELMVTSVGKLARQNPIPEQAARSYTSDVLDGLIYIHSQDMIHRDIKGDNILLDSNGTAKLADLGLSKYAVGAYKSARGSVAGTYAYLSPELFDEMPAGRRSDLWAVGVTVYEMIMQRPPFGDERSMVMLKRTANLGQRRLVSKLTTSQNLKDFLLSIFVEFEERPQPNEIRKHRWLTTRDASGENYLNM